MTTPTQQHPYVNVPGTVSKEAQEFLRTLRDPALMPAFPDAGDLAGWKKVQAFAEAAGTATSAPRLKRYEHTVRETSLGGVPVLDVRPKNWADNGKVLVYTHGGAHVMSSAASTLGRAVIAAHETGLRVISVDYTLAPFAKYDQMSDQVIAAIQALSADAHPGRSEGGLAQRLRADVPGARYGRRDGEARSLRGHDPQLPGSDPRRAGGDRGAPEDARVSSSASRTVTATTRREIMATRDETGPWDAALAQLREWDPAWAEACVKMTTNPWGTGVLPRKIAELIGIALNAACTNLDPGGTRRHIRAALEAGPHRGGH